MDFCYVWLRKALAEDVPAFASHTTRTSGELTGNTTMQRGMEQFTVGLARVFAHYAAALKSGAPFVFTYHHNDPAAYVPVVVAVLDAGLDCTATLPVPAEMEASLHINGNDSSILDSVFVCRRHAQYLDERSVHEAVEQDAEAMVQAGVRVSDSDRRCLWAGHVARRAINRLRDCWDTSMSISEKMHVAAVTIIDIAAESGYKSLARNGRKGRSIA
jgi:adenine-specific DNA methylase